MNMKIALGLLLSFYAAQAADVEHALQDINEQSIKFTLDTDDHMCTLCTEVAHIYLDLGGQQDDADLQTLLDAKQQPVTYEALLNIVKKCIDATWPNNTSSEQLRAQLQALHDELLEEYDHMLAQLTVRRRKCKNYCQVVAANLVACRANIKGHLTVGGSATINNSLRVDNLNGVLLGENGLITTGLVTNSDLADNSVTSDQIAPMSILPSKLAFNTVDTFAGEPNPLRIYRGTVAADGSITDGAGFSIDYTDPGQYVVTLSQAYATATSYQVFVRPRIAIGDDVKIVITNHTTSSFLVEVADPTGAPLVNLAFDFFTIGSRP